MFGPGAYRPDPSDGMRAIADRTGKYAGSDEPHYLVKGDTLLKCTVTVYKMVDGVRCPFVGLALYEEFNNPKNKQWQSTDNSSPYQNEWNALIDAIVNDKPYNEVKRGVEASLVTSMGRMAAHTGQEITFDQMLNSDHEFAPDVDKLKEGSPAPLKADEKGMYPQPMPGKKKTEY